MDELTRERFWPKAPRSTVLDEEDLIAERRRILLGEDDAAELADVRRHVRLRADRMRRDRRLVKVIRSLQ